MAINQRPNREKATDSQLAFVDKGGSAAKKDAPNDKLPQHPLKFPPADRLEKCRKATVVKLAQHLDPAGDRGEIGKRRVEICRISCGSLFVRTIP